MAWPGTRHGSLGLHCVCARMWKPSLPKARGQQLLCRIQQSKAKAEQLYRRWPKPTFEGCGRNRAKTAEKREKKSEGEGGVQSLCQFQISKNGCRRALAQLHMLPCRHHASLLGLEPMFNPPPLIPETSAGSPLKMNSLCHHQVSIRGGFSFPKTAAPVLIAFRDWPSWFKPALNAWIFNRFVRGKGEHRLTKCLSRNSISKRLVSHCCLAWTR